MLAIGAQTPVLALLALRRPRVLVAVVAPYLVLVPVAVAIGGLAPTLELGALLLAAAPAELAAPALARAVGGRAETAAAVMTGTLVVSFALLLTVVGPAGASAATANTAFVALAVGAAAAGAVPTARDAVLGAIRLAANVALAILVANALVGGIAALDGGSVLAALALLAAGTLAAAVGTAVLGGDVVASVLGGGTRDFAVAATLAADLAPSAAALPLVYGALLFGLLGALAAARALRSRSARRNGA